MANWMSDGTSLDTGAGYVGGIDTDGKTALSVLQACETTEQGRLFIDASGLVRFISRTALSTTSTYKTSQRTYGDSGSELPYTDFQSAYDDRLVYNRVEVTRVYGPTVTVDDSTSQSQYFIRSQAMTDLIANSDQQSNDIANARLYLYKQPRYRVSSISVNPRANPSTLYPAVIGDEIGTRVTVKRRPQGVGSSISQELLIEGIEHSIGPMDWRTTYNLSPAPPVYFTLDSSTFGVLDSNLLGY
jgi:hypothetical protein